jgi:hypothetical protein
MVSEVRLNRGLSVPKHRIVAQLPQPQFRALQRAVLMWSQFLVRLNMRRGDDIFAVIQNFEFVSIDEPPFRFPPASVRVKPLFIGELSFDIFSAGHREVATHDFAV